MSAKYELTGERNAEGLYRIRALRDIPRHGVRAGDLGGWVAGEANLAQDGDCWVADDAQVFGGARVYGQARVYDDAQVSGEARVSDEACVFGGARVYGEAWVFGKSRVSGGAWVFGESQVFGGAMVSAESHVLSGTGLPSGSWTLFRTRSGHMLKVGCWMGTTEDLRDLVAGDDWPAARGEQVVQRRPMLSALADMCDAVIATWEPGE